MSALGQKTHAVQQRLLRATSGHQRRILVFQHLTQFCHRDYLLGALKGLGHTGRSFFFERTALRALPLDI